jgi:signal transduction histidine kinase
MKYQLLYIFLLLFIFSCKKDIPENTAIRVSEINLDSSYLKVNFKAVKNFRKFNQLDSVHFYSKKLERLSEEKSNDYYLGESQYFHGYYHYYKNQIDSSYYYFNRSRNFFTRIEDSIGIVKSMRAMSLAQTKVGDYDGAKQTSLATLYFIPHKNSSQTKSEIYLVLGYTATVQKDHQTAIDFYEKALSESINTKSKYGVLNNMVHNYLALGEKSPHYYKKASTILNTLQKDTYELVKANLLSSTLDNLGYIEWKTNPNFNSNENTLMMEALALRKRDKDQMGILFSYSNLSEFYAQTNRTKALKYADSLYTIATLLHDHPHQLEALKHKIELDDVKKAKKHAIRYKTLRDSLEEVREKNIAQFAKIRFEITEKRKENTRLKAELIENNLKIKRNKNISYLIIIFVVFSTIFLIYLYRLQLIKNQKKLTDEIQKAEQKLSSKVHDELANSLYQTISYVDNIESIENDSVKEKLIEKLDNVYKLSRDISRESQSIKTNEFYPQEIFSLISYYKTDTTNIILVGFEEEPWKNIPEMVKLHFYKILQELLTNMRKHSQSSLVSLKFEFSTNKLEFTYSDNGVGMDSEGLTPSNGLRNIASRVDIIKGKGQILPSTRGFKFSLNIPLDLPKR